MGFSSERIAVNHLTSCPVALS